MGHMSPIGQMIHIGHMSQFPKDLTPMTYMTYLTI